MGLGVLCNDSYGRPMALGSEPLDCYSNTLATTFTTLPCPPCVYPTCNPGGTKGFFIHVS